MNDGAMTPLSFTRCRKFRSKFKASSLLLTPLPAFKGGTSNLAKRRHGRKEEKEQGGRRRSKRKGKEERCFSSAPLPLTPSLL